MTRPIISFLLGSGFSIPEGLPSVRDLSKRLSKIDENEILIHTDQRAFFLNGQEDRNRHTCWDQRIFLQEFLEFYNTDILKSNELFHYETFYDFYSGYLSSDQNETVITDFYNKFEHKYYGKEKSFRDCKNRIHDFNRSFNQLMASQLRNHKYEQNITHLNYPNFGMFIRFLSECLKENDIKVHTLNHDLFFDFLGKHTSDLFPYFSDGFTLAGSQFYGVLSHNFTTINNESLSKWYYIKLEQFNNSFNKPLSLYKLHGSIDNTIARDDHNTYRLKSNYAVNQVYMEVKDEETGEYKFDTLWDEAAPDFLSGTTNKIRYYHTDPHYIKIFEHFKNNLLKSELLFVIGYGFQDNGVNEYLENHFLTPGKKMIVIDPHKPDTILLEKYNAIHCAKSIIDVSYEEYWELIKT